MLALTLLVYCSYVLYFLFGTICVACGLYYLADFVEEYTVFSKKIIRAAILAIVTIHVVLLVFEALPMFQLLIGLLSHMSYLMLMKGFPVIELTSPLFIVSCVLAVSNHFAWFTYFTQEYFPFSEVLALFCVCVWAIPFALFISLSANDNALPGAVGGGSGFSTPGDAYGEGQRKTQNRLLSFFSFLNKKKEENSGLFGASSGVKLT